MAIGGYFEMEAFDKNQESYQFHHQANFKNGRSSLLYILKILRPSHLYVPYYTCDCLFEPIIQSGISYSFYSINEKFEINSPIELSAKEYLIYINYWGIKSDYIKRLQNEFNSNLILDNTQAFFYTDSSIWSFNSVRKFMGLPDGSFLYGPDNVQSDSFKKNTAANTDYLNLRAEGNVSAGYKSFCESESKHNAELELASAFTFDHLDQIDYFAIKEKRRSNFSFIAKYLDKKNKLSLDSLDEQIPFFYPYWPEIMIDKTLLWDEGIFVPNLWPDCQRTPSGFEFEKKIAKEIIPIPIDQRYDKQEMKKIISTIKKIEKRTP